jgi:hypothetical protein
MNSHYLLSVLIPTVVGREEQYKRLEQRLWNDVAEQPFQHLVYWDFIKDNKEITIGEKREQLYKKSTALYSWQIDDDDSIDFFAVGKIIDAIKSNPEVDCITFEEHIDIDGKIEKSNHSLAYADWEGEGGKELWDGFHYHRTPFFKSVIKTEIARSVPIPHIRFGEDHQWAQALKPHLKSEIHISQQLYKYIHRSSPHAERYGFDK